MGGSGSKEYVPEETHKTESILIPINGVKTGDVFTLKGKLSAHYDMSRLFVVNFFNGNDIAFHFKVIFLEQEKQFNMVKMNTRTGDKWGEEILKENVIFLNRFFELKFTCQQGKFVACQDVDIDGKHFADYNHRTSPELITAFETEGYTGFTKIDLPNRVSPAAKQTVYLQTSDDREEHIPSFPEVQQFVQSLTDHGSIVQAATQDEEFKQLSELLTDGLQITKKMLEEQKGSFLKDVAKYGGYLFGIYRGGTAVFAFIDFILKYGEPSQTEQILKKLEEISEELKRIEATIAQGFAEVIEHLDFVQFREDVLIPVRTMFDLYVRCYTVNGKLPVDDFGSYCTGKTSPRAVFSAMYEFLEGRKNIFETHLKTKKYVYSVYDEWSTAIYNYATKLIVMNMVLLGIIAKENETSGKSDLLINEEREAANLINQLIRMDERLKQIEADRMKTFHMEGYAKEFLLERFNKIKYAREKNGTIEGLPRETLSVIAEKMNKSWKDFNGPTDYYIVAVRGRYGKEKDGSHRRYAGWLVAAPEKVTVVENIGQLSSYNRDYLCLALIQPLTKEDRQANMKVYSEEAEKLKSIIATAIGEQFIFPSKTVAKIVESINSMAPFKPILILYNTDTSTSEFSAKIEGKYEMEAIAYEMTGESWSSVDGPFPLKYRWKNFIDHFYPAQFIHHVHREVQIVFQY